MSPATDPDRHVWDRSLDPQVVSFFLSLQAASKPHQKVVTAVGRELLGFIWAIGVQVERSQAPGGAPTMRLVA